MFVSSCIFKLKDRWYSSIETVGEEILVSDTLGRRCLALSSSLPPKQSRWSPAVALRKSLRSVEKTDVVFGDFGLWAKAGGSISSQDRCGAVESVPWRT